MPACLMLVVGVYILRKVRSYSNAAQQETKELMDLVGQFKSPDAARAELRRLQKEKDELERKLKRN